MAAVTPFAARPIRSEGAAYPEVVAARNPGRFRCVTSAASGVVFSVRVATVVKPNGAKRSQK